ncbi:MAG: hypothetical protein EOM20_10205 [Spartobacteria bacterium]|nr:hypothetical protein [Spartobacteria bacterium]
MMTTPTETVMACPACKGAFTPDQMMSPILFACPGCRRETQVLAFPALLRPLQKGAEGETLLVDTDASCFYHPDKRAVRPCDGCGRFLCSLCDVELGQQHLCPQCIQTGVKKNKIETLNREITAYDNMALALALYPVLFWMITCITAPAALFVVARYWNRKTSIVPRGKYRFVAAAIIALLQIAGWIFFIALMIHKKG